MEADRSRPDGGRKETVLLKDRIIPYGDFGLIISRQKHGCN